MTLHRLLGALLLLALCACATTPEPRPDAWYVVRHFEKLPGDDPALSAEGRENAERLADLLRDDPPDAIWVSTTRRARESAAPLAARLGLAPKEYDPRDTPALLQALRAEPGSILVVGHSNTVPDIVAGLGGVRPADLNEAEDYGDVWIVIRQSGATERKSLGGR